MLHEHSRRATIALRKLSEVDIAFSSLSLFCKHRDASEDLSLHGEKAPAWTDGKTIFYGPSFEEFSLEEKVGVCAHEILHIALRHISRAKQLIRRFGAQYNPLAFNIATDAINNQALLLSGRQLPRPCIVLSELFEEVFGETTPPHELLAEWDAERLYVRLANETNLGKGAMTIVGIASGGGSSGGNGSEGGGPGGINEALKKYLEKSGFQEDFFPNPHDDANTAQEDSEWSRRINQALSAGKLAGRGIGTLGHKIADLPKSRTPWEILLRSVIAKATARKPRISDNTPSRRFLAMDANARQFATRTPVFEPGFEQRSRRPKVAVCVDVSGSISNALLEQFAGEIAGIGNRTGAEIHVLVFDTKVISNQKLDGRNYKQEISSIEFARGGGTSFVEVVEEAQAIDPSIIVVLTDLCGPFGNAPGATPVIWTIPASEAPTTPPFGKIISMAA